MTRANKGGSSITNKGGSSTTNQGGSSVDVSNNIAHRHEQYASLQRDVEQTRTPVPAEPDLKVGPQPILVDKVELYPRENAEKHNTHLYELMDAKDSPLIIRRGQSFKMEVRFKKNFDPLLESVRLHFEFGPPPHLVPKGNLVNLTINNQSAFTREKTMWDIRTEKHEGATVNLDVQVSGTAPVGVWKMKIYSYVPGNKDIEPTVFEIPQNVYILFNPWSKEDTVFMDREDAKKEYVLNDVGKVYVGEKKRPYGRRWIYGQFHNSVLPAAMFMLDISKLDFTQRSSPILVSRAISKLVNCVDDKGILEGNWSGNYEGGRSPVSWTGSVDIIDEYFKNRGEQPVKYGQCWVFGAVTTTVCRALGIPCRTITNFSSAHDTDRSLTIDRYLSEEGEFLARRTKDSVWNFHVWNDVWMARPDLPTGYGGWQAIDATPQETSESVYQLGPASLEAIKRGQVGFNFDCGFVFAEVNADMVTWIRDKTLESGWRRRDTFKRHVGQLILTKKVGVDDDNGERDAENITGDYKLQEGTEEQRMAVLNAAFCGVKPRVRRDKYDMPMPKAEDVKFDLLDIEKIIIGKPFDVTVKMKNKNQSEVRTVVANLSANTVYYTGILARKVFSERKEFKLQPNQSEVLSITVKADDYLDKLVDHSLIKIFTIAQVQETRQIWTEEDDFTVEKPKLELECPDTLKVRSPVELVIRLTNPLNLYLTDCVFAIEGPGLIGEFIVRFRDIAPLESIVHKERMFPQKHGKRAFVATFNSKELTEVIGSKNVEVLPAA